MVDLWTFCAISRSITYPCSFYGYFCTSYHNILVWGTPNKLHKNFFNIIYISIKHQLQSHIIFFNPHPENYQIAISSYNDICLVCFYLWALSCSYLHVSKDKLIWPTHGDRLENVPRFFLPLTIYKIFLGSSKSC